MRKVVVVLAAIFMLASVVVLSPATAAAEKAVLSFAPNVPKPVTRTNPTNVVVELETIEKEGVLDGETKYEFWTFNGTVPGPMARVRVGDTVELRLKNSSHNGSDHGIDLHAVAGPGGGMAVMLVEPGKHKAFKFKALKPGAYLYHCAAPHIPTHVSNGMYGMIIVDPVGGYSKVDHEFYIMQSEFYIDGKKGDKGLQFFSHDKGLEENPDYVVFNGKVGALTGAGTLQVKTGETIRMYVGNIGPNLISSFHIIGEIFDTVYQEAGTLANHNIQTTLIPAGGVAVVEFVVDVPGNYALVDHSIFRAIEKGAVGILTATGDPKPDLFGSIK